MCSNFKGSFKFPILSLFIALHLTTQVVVSDLPNNTDIMKATSCMRQFFGETSLEKSFRKTGHTFTDGEYFGILCPKVDTEEIRNLIRNNAQGDYEGTPIKECLAKTNSENLFKHYVKLGQRSKEATEHEKPDGSEDYRTRSTQNSDLLNTPPLNFQRGVCQSKIETVEFSELTDEKENKETVQCLTKCTNNFMHRITSYLSSAMDKVTKPPFSKLIQITSDSRILESIPNPSQRFTTEKFYSELEKENETSSGIAPITQLGKQYLVTYSKVYIALDKYISDRLRKTIADLAQLDHRLFTMFLVYQNCARLDCAMGLNSTPLYNLIKSGAKDTYWKILQAFTNDNENLRDWIHDQTGDWQTFCNVFTN